jgi:hypothetical protein
MTPTCEWPDCKRMATVDNGWGVLFCEGHFIVGEANADSHGEHGISSDEYIERMTGAAMWFSDNQ